MDNFNKNKIVRYLRDFCGECINPQRDWIILIVVFIILVVSLGLSNFNIYKETNSKELFVDISKEVIIIRKVKEKDLTAVISKFGDREIKFNSLKPTKLIDPSL